MRNPTVPNAKAGAPTGTRPFQRPEGPDSQFISVHYMCHINVTMSIEKCLFGYIILRTTRE